jgi:UPF0288 family protein (methanogenesis marker protein 3)
MLFDSESIFGVYFFKTAAGNIALWVNDMKQKRFCASAASVEGMMIRWLERDDIALSEI